MLNGLKQDLARILWIGGSPCSGKSSIARILADRYELQTYHCDEAFDEHRKRVVPDKHPMLHKWTNTPWDELWMQPVAVLVTEAIVCYHEHFNMIIDDVLSLPRSASILVEGTAFLPNRVCRVLLNRHQAMWILSTELIPKTALPQSRSVGADHSGPMRGPQPGIPELDGSRCRVRKMGSQDSK